MTEKSFRQRCAEAIDTSWHSSWHWPERDWQAHALKDAYRRQDRLIVSLSEVHQIIEELKLREQGDD